MQTEQDSGTIAAMCQRGKELLKELTPSSEAIEALLLTPAAMVTEQAARVRARAAGDGVIGQGAARRGEAGPPPRADGGR